MGALDVGTRRIVEVAGLAASRARVIFLDEPAAGQAAAESARLAKGLIDPADLGKHRRGRRARHLSSARPVIH
ncbi:hypothetical protein [Streptomyces sp. NPDC052693]|uniref:hypothetical protein n=1 Tax=Streptomyces sp. NPDC052693 TaxID=3155814 RepID=UPI0034448F40